MAMMFDGFSLQKTVAFSPERFEGRELELKGIDLQWRATSSLASPELTNSRGTGQGAVVQCFTLGGLLPGQWLYVGYSSARV